MHPPIEDEFEPPLDATVPLPPASSPLPSSSSSETPETTLNPVKEGEHKVLWDPRDWLVRYTDTRSPYYHYHHSYDYPPRWGVHRVPAISKHNSPFNKQNPLILYPGRLVYTMLHQQDSNEHYYVFVEGHIHEKKAKKSAQMLVFLPEQCRPPISAAAPPDVQLGHCFQVLNLNHIDALRTYHADPFSCTWEQYNEVKELMQDLMELPSLPDICIRGVDILPVAASRAQKRKAINYAQPADDDSSPVADDHDQLVPIPVPEAETKVGQRDRRKSAPYTPEPISSGAGSKKPRGGSEKTGEDTRQQDKSSEPAPKKPRKSSVAGTRGSTGNVSSFKEKATELSNPSGGSSTVIPSQFTMSLPVVPASTPTAVPTSLSLSKTDRDWIASEFRIACKDNFNSVMVPYLQRMEDTLRASIKGSREAVVDCLRSLSKDSTSTEAELVVVKNSLSKVERDIGELLKTPKFSWDQVVSQFDMYSKISRGAGDTARPSYGGAPAHLAGGIPSTAGYVGAHPHQPGMYDYMQRPTELPYAPAPIPGTFAVPSAAHPGMQYIYFNINICLI